LHAGDLDGEIGIGGIFHRNHGLGRRQGHADHNQERDDGPGDFDGSAFVEGCRLVADRLAMLENRIKHHPEHSDEDHHTDDQHQIVQRVDLFRDFRDRRGKVQLTHSRATRTIDDRPRRHACHQERRTEHQGLKALRKFHNFLKSQNWNSIYLFDASALRDSHASSRLFRSIKNRPTFTLAPFVSTLTKSSAAAGNLREYNADPA